jgi:P27 family predicted phage terminase small subunit
MRGRKPTPSHLKLVLVNPGKRPLNRDEPRFELAIPEAPSYLTPDAKLEWDYHARSLFAAGVLTRMDRACLGIYCQALADLARHEGQIRSYGEIQKTNGAAQISVLVVLRNRARETVRKFAAELGLTPASRSRVSVRTERAKDDPAHKYIG